MPTFTATNTEKTVDYIGNYIYQNDTLQYILTQGGRLLPKATGGFEYEYHIADHLGNTRVTIRDSVGYAVVQQENHYYPFGMNLAGQSYTNPQQAVANKYQYNEQCGGMENHRRGKLPIQAT